MQVDPADRIKELIGNTPVTEASTLIYSITRCYESVYFSSRPGVKPIAKEGWLPHVCESMIGYCKWCEQPVTPSELMENDGD